MAKAKKAVKTAKKTAAKKTSAKKANVVKRVASPRLAPEDKVVVLKKENPFREGTKVHKRVNVVLTHSNKTVAELMKHGARTSTIHWLENHKIVKVTHIPA